MSRVNSVGALGHPAFQRLGGFEARRDVGEGGDDAAVRHPVGAHFDHEPALGKPLQERLGRGRIAREPVANQDIDVACAVNPVDGVEAQEFVEPRADPDDFLRQPENLSELPVPADELHVLVEHRDRFADMLERGLQDFAVIVDGGVGVVEQLERGLGRDRALAQQQRQHEP